MKNSYAIHSVCEKCANFVSSNMAGLTRHAITEYGLIGAGVSAVLAMASGAMLLDLRAHDRKLSADSNKAKYAVVCTASIVLFLLCLSMAFVSYRSTRALQRQPFALSGARMAEFASLEPIDAHTHVFETGPAFVGMLERLHVHVLDILYVDDTVAYRNSMEPQEQDARRFIAFSMGHAQLCTTFDPFRFNDAKFSKDVIDALNQDFERGAIAVKIWKNIGMEIKNASGQYVMPDDQQLEPIYRDIAAHNKTLIAHLAEPDVAWDSQNVTTSRYYAANPQWNMSTKPDAPQKRVILQARDHILAMNPDLRVVGAHLGSMEDHLDDVATRFELYPNFAVDTAGRVSKLIAQPRDKVRAFMLRYQDRILYGTDLSFSPGESDQATTQSWEKQYARDWRYFATDDSFEYGGRKVEGLNLPRSVLKKLYHENAVQWIPGIDSNLR